MGKNRNSAACKAIQLPAHGEKSGGNASIRGKPLSDLSDSIERKKKVQNVQKRLRTSVVKAYHASVLTVPLSGRVWTDVKSQLTSVLENNVSNQYFIG